MSILVNMPEGEVRVEEGVELLAVTPSPNITSYCEHCYFNQAARQQEPCPEVTHFSEGARTICDSNVQNGREVFFIRPDDYALLRLQGKI